MSELPRRSSTTDDVREFLVSRRANITPQQAGLPDFGGERRVPGLRREEVAALAQVSADYYVRLERGRIRGASPSVLNAIARALQLTEAEREHLFALADAAPPSIARTATPHREVRGSVQRVLDSMAVPAVVLDARQDFVAANLMGRAMHAPHFDTDGTANNARFVFLDLRAQDYYADWVRARRVTAAMLRLEAGRDPLNEGLTALIGELSTRSPVFRQDWAGHDVHQHATGTKSLRHPVVGELEVYFDVFHMPGEPGLQIVTHSPVPGTASVERFALLASWAATLEQAADYASAEDSPGKVPMRKE